MYVIRVFENGKLKGYVDQYSKENFYNRSSKELVVKNIYNSKTRAEKTCNKLNEIYNNNQFDKLTFTVESI